MGDSADYRDFLVQSYMDLISGVESFEKGSYTSAVHMVNQGVEKLVKSIAMYYDVEEVRKFSHATKKVSNAINQKTDHFQLIFSKYNNFLTNSFATHQESSYPLTEGMPPLLKYDSGTAFSFVDDAVDISVELQCAMPEEMQKLLTSEMIFHVKSMRQDVLLKPVKVVNGFHQGVVYDSEIDDGKSIGKIFLEKKVESDSVTIWIYASRDQIESVNVGAEIKIDKSDDYQFLFEIKRTLEIENTNKLIPKEKKSNDFSI